VGKSPFYDRGNRPNGPERRGLKIALKKRVSFDEKAKYQRGKENRGQFRDRQMGGGGKGLSHIADDRDRRSITYLAGWRRQRLLCLRAIEILNGGFKKGKRCIPE